MRVNESFRLKGGMDDLKGMLGTSDRMDDMKIFRFSSLEQI